MHHLCPKFHVISAAKRAIKVKYMCIHKSASSMWNVSKHICDTNLLSFIFFGAAIKTHHLKCQRKHFIFGEFDDSRSNGMREYICLNGCVSATDSWLLWLSSRMFTFVAPLGEFLECSPPFDGEKKFAFVTCVLNWIPYIHSYPEILLPLLLDSAASPQRLHMISMWNVILFQNFATKEVLMNTKVWRVWRVCQHWKMGRQMPRNARAKTFYPRKNMWMKMILSQDECCHVFVLTVLQTISQQFKKR